MLLPLKNFQWYHRIYGDGIQKSEEPFLSYTIKKSFNIVGNVDVRSENVLSFNSIIEVLSKGNKSYSNYTFIRNKASLKYSLENNIRSVNSLRFKQEIQTNSKNKALKLLNIL